MATLGLSLWLPISRPNFYNFTDVRWLDLQPTGRPGEYVCSSKQIEDRSYVPYILVPVMRRLLEVLPRSFGYDRTGACVVRGGEQHERRRPTNLTMTLDLTRYRAKDEADADGPPNFCSVANGKLRSLGATAVELHVDENGSYTFTLTYPDGADPGPLRKALVNHIREVFGGGFDTQPMQSTLPRRAQSADSRSIKAYNGLREMLGSRHDPHQDEDNDIVESEPRGALAFSQLNVLVEGLWNLSLLPGFYLERDDLTQGHAKNDGRTEFVRSVGDMVGVLITEADARTTLGQVTVLHHFLSITATGPLTTLKSALQSVRRRLLDEIIASMHRRNPLSQLRFSTHRRERRPELASGATANELKGYTAVVSAKFPLILGVNEVARLATDHLDWVVHRGGPLVPPDQSYEELQHLVRELTRVHGLLDHWRSLTAELNSSVESLSETIEHGWMEEMLYEQKQTRSEQEAMAEIQRGRLSRPSVTQSPARAAYNLTMLLLAVVAVVFTVNVSDLNKLGQPETTVWDVVYLLRYVWLAMAVAFVILPLSTFVVRSWREFSASQPSYPYEFAIHLEEGVSPDKLAAHVCDDRRRRLGTALLGTTRAVNRGYGRIERISRDNTILKAHITVTSRVSARFWWPRYARFEIINEIANHRTGRDAQYLLVQSRIFGESPKPISPERVRELIRVILLDVLRQVDDADEPSPTGAEAASETGVETGPETGGRLKTWLAARREAKQAKADAAKRAQKVEDERARTVADLLRRSLPGAEPPSATPGNKPDETPLG